MKTAVMFMLMAGVVLQQRDVRSEPTGTAVLSGIVQTADNDARPLRRATVRLSGGSLLTGRLAFTTDDGRFEFVGLPAGQYTLSATKSPYMGAELGAKRPGGAGAPVTVVDGERLTNLVFRLYRYAEISGVIYDQNGDPVQGVSVEALRYTMRTGRRTLSNVYGRPETTDDRGAYRLGGLTPGQYYVATGPSPSRGPTDLQVLNTSDIDRVLQRLNSGGALSGVTFDQPHQGFAPVFFPGAPEFSRAQPITLALGEERRGVNIRLQLVPTARVTGTVTMADGTPATNAMVVATQVAEAFSMDLFAAGTLGSATVDAAGRFLFPAVAPGRVVITARTPPSTTGGPLWALSELSINGSDQNVSLTMQPGMTVSGRLSVASGPATANLGGIVVGLTTTQADAVTLGVPSVNVEPDGAFRITGAAPGQYLLSVSRVPAASGLVVRSAMVQGTSVDALDLPLTIEPGRSVDNVVITLTDKPTELSGTLQTPAGTPTADYFIIVFSADQKYWTPNSRRSVMTRPSNTGKYSFRNLPPGDYCVAAVTDVEFGDWFNPEFLAALLAASPAKATLGEGEKKTLDLRVGTPDGRF